ncbi:MAG TPA: ABC transporter permease subunit, partial [Gammaproteobacteria bacterium]
ALCVSVALLTLRLQRLPEVEISIEPVAVVERRGLSLVNPLLIALAAVYVGMPLLSMLLDALSGPWLAVLRQASFWQAVANTLFIGLGAALLSVTAGWFLLRYGASLAYDGRTQAARWIELAGSVVYVVPPLVIGTGMFVLLSSRVDVFDWVYPIVIAVNALMGLPFVIRSLAPPMRQNHARYQRLCRSLALGGWNRFRHLEWPLLRRPLGLAAGLVAALAMGDLGVIALFGTPDSATLSLLIYQQLGAYRVAEATVTALLLLALCLAAFWLLERGIGGSGDA